VIFIVKNRNT